MCPAVGVEIKVRSSWRADRGYGGSDFGNEWRASLPRATLGAKKSRSKKQINHEKVDTLAGKVIPLKRLARKPAASIFYRNLAKRQTYVLSLIHI